MQMSNSFLFKTKALSSLTCSRSWACKTYTLGWQNVFCSAKNLNKFCLTNHVKSILSLHQQALFSLAENLNGSKRLFLSFWILHTTKWPTELEKKLTSPFALEGIFLYLYRDRVNIALAEHAGEHFIASDHGGCQMTVHFNFCESDAKVESVAKTIALNFLLLRSWWQNITTFSQLTKSKNWSALMTNWVSVAQNKSNVVTTQTILR